MWLNVMRPQLIHRVEAPAKNERPVIFAGRSFISWDSHIDRSGSLTRAIHLCDKRTVRTILQSPPPPLIQPVCQSRSS